MSFVKTIHEGGVLAPFFDRCQQSESPKVLNEEALIASIEENIQMLLNTRMALNKKNYLAMNPAGLTYGVPQLYGLPDFSWFDGARRDTWPQQATLIEQAIRLFEPRLQNPQVALKEFQEDKQKLWVHIRGTYHMDGVHKTLEFPLCMDNFS
jgi:type VI secretion system protein ImpF